MTVVEKLRKFWRNRAGGFALQAAVFSPVLLGASAVSIDFMNYANHRSQLQEVADAAAMAAVREAAIKGWNPNIAQSIANAVVASNFEKDDGSSNTIYKAVAYPDETTRSVSVVVTQDHFPYFSARVFPTPQIAVDAVATSAASKDNICVIALENKKDRALSLKTQSSLVAPTCAVYSNSTHNFGMEAIG
ncbi:MAG: pilus assembly protein TadG-related protein, partial [Pseudomonadota bacterium]